MLRRYFPGLLRTLSKVRWFNLAGPALVGLVWAGQVGAAVPVEDMSTGDLRTGESAAQTVTPAPVPQVSTASATVGAAREGAAREGSPRQNTQLFYELQVLQSEVQQLRGLVEDQAYEISRLRDLQRSQYLDIDRRLTEDGRSASRLAQSGPAAPTAAQTNPAVTVAQGPIRDTSEESQVAVPIVQTASGQTAGTQRPAPVVEPASESAQNLRSGETLAATTTALVAEVVAVAPTEQVAYERAFGLMKDQQFEQSIRAYQGVIESFPDGRFAPESRYWLGELYLMSDRLEAARGSFASVVEVYPAHQKVPLSLYKLGVVNHRLGATPAALEYLDNVVTRYPDTPAAGLARTYAAELR